MKEPEARNILYQSGLRLLKEGLVARSWGNVSIRIDKETMVITPGGIEYQKLAPGDMVIVNIYSLDYKGELKPSSEKNLHAEIYRSRSEINAIIHTHQQNASTLAAARRDLPPIFDDMAQIIGPGVRVADYAPSSSRKIVKKTVKALKGRKAALMANHGAVCIGRDMEEAFVVAQILEKAARSFIEAEFLGGAKVLGKFESSMMHREYIKKYSKQNRLKK